MLRADVVPATLLHCLQLGDTIRPEDRAELAACGHADVHAVLLYGLKTSTFCRALLVGPDVGAIFGVGPIDEKLPDLGQVWFLTGAPFPRHPRAFMRVARRCVAELLEQFPVIGNLIDARYAAAVRWAKWLGFDVGEPVPFGPEGRLFHPARLERARWVE